jgi:hypothetical protein
MGERGPIPKRSDQRRRRNAVEGLTAGAARPAEIPEPDAHWNDLARDWFLSLGRSGQADYYQDSDWQTARVWAEVLSRQLEAGRMSSQLIMAWSAGATSLLATEGDRRRIRLELERMPAEPSGPDEVEDELDAHRTRRTGKPARDAARGSA